MRQWGWDGAAVLGVLVLRPSSVGAKAGLTASAITGVWELFKPLEGN